MPLSRHDARSNSQPQVAEGQLYARCCCCCWQAACTGADPALLLLRASLCPSGTQIAAQVLAPRPDWRDVALKPDLREGGLHVFGMSSMLWEHPLQRSLPAPIRCAVRRSIDCCGAPLAAKRGSEQSGAFAVLSPACRAIPSARCAAARCTRRPRARGLACPSTQKLTHHLLLLLC